MDTRTSWQQRIGVGEKQPPPPQGSTRKRVVTSDDGPLRGAQVGYAVDHKDGRVDAVVNTMTVTPNPRIKATRTN
jgi:hypothetical protein